MHYAFAAFCPTRDLDAWNCTQCLDPDFKSLGVVQGEITEVFGFVGYNAALDTIIVSFRGTDNVPNDFVDADVCIFPIDDPFISLIDLQFIQTDYADVPDAKVGMSD